MIAVRDGSEQEDLSRELSGRYAGDYRIVVCDEPAGLRPSSEPGTGGHAGGPGRRWGRHGGSGWLEVLAGIRAIDPTAARVAAVRWGAWETARPIFDAVTLGKIDHWMYRPKETPDEDFHSRSRTS